MKRKPKDNKRSGYQDQGKRLTEQTVVSKKKYKRKKEKKVIIERNQYGNYYEE